MEKNLKPGNDFIISCVAERRQQEFSTSVVSLICSGGPNQVQLLLGYFQ